jgi:site-specific recombinase XerD
MSPLRIQYIGLLTLRGYTQRTQESYINAVAALSRHYGHSPHLLSDGQVRAYLVGLHQRGLSRSTVNVAISALRVFYRDLLKRPVARIEECLPRPRKVTRRARVYSREELGSLFVTGCRSLRDRAFLMTVYGAGLRLNEACHLKFEDVESSRGMLRVNQGKGNKDRYTVLSPWLLEVLRDYWRQFRPQGSWLFPALRLQDKPMVDGSAQLIFCRALKRAGLPNRGGIHCLRHSFATHLLEDGVDVLTIKKLMGHANFATTAGYLHVSAEQAVRVRSPLDVIAPPPVSSSPPPPPPPSVSMTDPR